MSFLDKAIPVQNQPSFASKATPVNYLELEKQLAPPQDEGFFSKLVNFGKDVLSSQATTMARGVLGTTNPVFSAVQPLLPEKVETPIGDVGLRYSTEPKTKLLQLGEDTLNLSPGGAVKKTPVELAEQGAKGFAGKLMKSAFRINANDLKKSPELIKNFLTERLSAFTKKGMAAKADATVNLLEKQLDDVIASATKIGAEVDAKEVVRATEPLIAKYENSAFPEYAQKVKEKVVEFLKRGKIPVKEAQEFKKNTYQIIRESGYGGLQGPDKETAKQIARGVKEELEKAIPEIKDLGINKKLAIFGKARDLMERQINVAGRNELIPFKDIVLTGATQSIWPSLARLVIESTPFKTFVANILTSEGLQTAKNIVKSVAPITKELVNPNLEQNQLEEE